MFRRRRVMDELAEAIRISKQLEEHTVTMLSDFEQALTSMRAEVARLTNMNSELEQAAQRKKER